MLTAADGGRGLRFTLFGFPVRVDLTFLLIAAFLGLGNGDVDLGLMATWVAVLGGSILAHELGHAFAARSLGARPNIVIHGMGGLTSYVPPRPPTRLQSIGVSLAGPAAGFGLGLVILVVALGAPTPPVGSLGELALRAAIYINLAWGLANLLPVLPLDGGHILVQLMPGDEAERHRRAAVVSMITAAVGAVVVWMVGLQFAAILFVVFGASNFAQVRNHRDEQRQVAEDDEVREALIALAGDSPGALDRIRAILRSTDRAPLRDGLKATVIEYLAVTRNPNVRAELDSLPGRVDPTIYALVNLAEAGPDAGLDELLESFANQPTPMGGRAVIMGATLVGHNEAILPAFVDGPAEARSVDVLSYAQDAAHRRGAHEASVGLGRLLLRSHPRIGPVPRYNLACSLAVTGRPDEALESLRDAVDHGWNDQALLDVDPDLAAVRSLVGFAEVRARAG